MNIKYKLLSLLLIVFLFGCETGRLAEFTNQRAITRPNIKFQSPTSSTKSFAVLYAQNAISFYQSLQNQFTNSIDLAVSQGTLTKFEGRQTKRAVNKRMTLLKRSLNSYINRFSSSLTTSQMTTGVIRFNSPFDPPFSIIPGASKKNKLKSLRTILGQVESFSGLAVSFTDSLHNAITASANSSQIALAQALTTKLNNSFKKDIKAIRKFINFINIRRFKEFNRKRINLNNFVGNYSGNCTNISNGRVEPLSAVISFDDTTNELTLSFPRPDNLYGPANTEIFSDTFTKRRGVSFNENLALFGQTKVKITRNGYIRGSIGSELTPSLNKVDFWGVAKKRDNSIFLDVRMDFASYSEGGQAHAIMELTK